MLLLRPDQSDVLHRQSQSLHHSRSSYASCGDASSPSFVSYASSSSSSSFFLSSSAVWPDSPSPTPKATNNLQFTEKCQYHTKDQSIKWQNWNAEKVDQKLK